MILVNLSVCASLHYSIYSIFSLDWTRIPDDNGVWLLPGFPLSMPTQSGLVESKPLWHSKYSDSILLTRNLSQNVMCDSLGIHTSQVFGKWQFIYTLHAQHPIFVHTLFTCVTKQVYFACQIDQIWLIVLQYYWWNNQHW